MASLPIDVKKFTVDLRRDLKTNPIKYLFVLPVTIFFTIFLVFPVILVFASAFRNNDGSFTLEFFQTVFNSEILWNPGGRTTSQSIEIVEPRTTDETWIIFDGVNRGVILNSIIIAFATTLVSLTIGIVIALFMARREFRGKRLVSILILIPLIIPPFVGGIGFNYMVGQEGILNTEYLGPWFGTRIIVQGIWAMVFVQSFHYYTLIYLNVYSSLINVDPSLEESAKNMGAEGFTLLRTVILPLALPGIAAGSILTFILSLEDVGTPLVFAEQGDTLAKDTMTVFILRNFQNDDPNSVSIIDQRAAVIGTILLLFALAGFLVIRKYVAMRSYSMLGKGRSGERSVQEATRRETIIFWIFFGIIFGLSIISHTGVLVLAISDQTAGRSWPPDFTTKHFTDVFSSSQDIFHFVQNTMVFSLLAIVIVLIFGTMAAYAISRIHFRGKTLFDTLITIPIALPGIVIGLGYIVLFTDTPSFDPFGITERFGVTLTLDPFVYPVILLICSYAVRKFPFAVRSIYAGLQQTSESLEEAALNMGASRMKSIRHITLPLISLNIVAGALIALVYTISEVSTTLILVSNDTYGTVTWHMADSVDTVGVFAALGVLLMSLQIISLIVSNFLLRDRAEAMTGI